MLRTTRKDLDRWAMSLFSEDPELLKLARRVSAATGAPILGGIAVFLHGYRRTTEDIDLFVEDARAVAEALERLGARWDDESREFVLEGVPIHLVTGTETGGPPRETVEIDDVPVVSLPDLIRFKLKSGLGRPERAQDIADVIALIRIASLDKRFAAKLPASLRAGFKKLVDAVRKAR
jgi:hypothetical protein